MIYLAFFWHQHQPYYRESVRGPYKMPWVRLHGVKDYNGMANLLAEFPEIKSTINYTPSLLQQLQDYISGASEDREYILSKKPAEELTRDEKTYILNTFFQAYEPHFILPYRRYKELYKKRAIKSKRAEDVLSLFSVNDFRDLAVWFNLTWIHQSEYKKYPELQEYIKKDRDFTVEERERVMAIHGEILANIIPQHTALKERGQIELTTTPYYHPILPLLINPASARIAMPTVHLPREMYRMKNDAHEQVRRGKEYAEQVFNTNITGMWPAEGSVSDEAVQVFTENGIKWIATDEGILERSCRSGSQAMPHFDRKGIYRPYRIEAGEKSLSIVFRDHNLSDLIGFKFQYYAPAKAAQEFIRNIEAIAKTVPENSIVPVILDGENAWEYYPDNATGFFRELYTRLSKHKTIKTTTISEYLENFPPKETIESLYSGSWINADFYIWMGHSEDQRAWDYLYKTRDDLIKAAESGGIDEAKLKEAWEELYIAEGSDWFWWYGDDHFSGQDDVFDYLFRKHLMNIYALIGKEAPDYLSIPISEGYKPQKAEQITSFIDIDIDGKKTSFFEWLKAGYYSPVKDSSSMTSVIDRKITDVYYGFNLKTCFLRIDFQPPFLEEGEELEIEFITGSKPKIRINSGMDAGTGILAVNGSEEQVALDWASDEIFEIGIPFKTLGFTERDTVQIYINIKKGGTVWERVPLTSPLTFRVPDEDYECYYWSV